MINDEWTTNDYLNLKNIGNGASFRVNLVYHIEKAELFALKIGNDTNNDKLIKRQLNNYSKIKHPLIPKLISCVKDSNGNMFGIITQFVNGQELD